MPSNALPVVLLFVLLGAEETTVLRGVVVDGDDRPVHDAVVVAAPKRPSLGEESASGTTDEAGRFEVPLRDGAGLRVSVLAIGFVPFDARDVDAGKPLRVVLTRGERVLEGFVRDGSTRDPIEGAIVEVRTGPTPAFAVTSNPRLGIVEAATDAKGAFLIGGLDAGPRYVSASAPGYGRAGRTVKPGETIEIFLLPGSGIYGLVLGEADSPVDGALVSLRSGSRTGISPSTQKTDAEGRFAILGVEPGEYHLLVRHADYAAAIVPDLRVEADRDVEITTSIRKGASVRGRVVDLDDRPLEGKVVLTRLEGEPVHWSERASLSTESKADGTFELLRVPPGEHELTVRVAGYALSRIPVSVSRSERPEDVGGVVLDRGLAIRGTVVDASGTGVAGVRVSGHASGRPELFVDFTMLPETVSEAGGSFVLSGLEEGMYRLGVFAPGVGGSDGLSARTGDENVRIVLEAVGAITGTAVDARGEPVKDVRVFLHRGEGYQRSFGGSLESPGTPGVFLVEEVIVGDYVADVSAPGFASSVVSDVVVKPGAVTSLGTVRLSRGGAVRGTVVDLSGMPVAGAIVHPIDPRQRRFGPEGQTTTGGDGAFTLEGLSLGTIELVASHPNYAEGRASVSIDTDAMEPVVQIRLSAGGRVEGYVRSRRMGPGTPRSILVLPTPPGPRRFGGSENMVSIGPDGHFAVEGIPAGKAQVLLLAAIGRLQSTIQSREIEIREGETTSVELESNPVHVQGMVRKGGSPVSGLEIVLTSEDVFGFSTFSMELLAGDATGAQFHRALTLDDGYYELFVDRPGSYRVRATAHGAGLPTKTVEIPDTDVFTLDLDYGGAAVAGRVVDAETGAPLQDASVAASPKDSARGERVWMRTGADGAFTLEVDPGSYVLTGNARDYGAKELNLTVGPEGRRDLVVALSKGLSIKGALRTSDGRSVPNARVYATADDPDPVPPSSPSGFGMSLPDGSYVVSSLPPGRYNVLAADRGGGFAFTPGITAGSEAVDLVLVPGAKAVVRVVDDQGTPAANALVAVIAIQGRKVRGIQMGADGEGRLELDVPPGSLLLKSVQGDDLEGLARVDVGPGASVSVKIVLRPK